MRPWAPRLCFLTLSFAIFGACGGLVDAATTDFGDQTDALPAPATPRPPTPAAPGPWTVADASGAGAPDAHDDGKVPADAASVDSGDSEPDEPDEKKGNIKMPPGLDAAAAPAD